MSKSQTRTSESLQMQFLVDLVGAPTNLCVEWPYSVSKQGYGIIKINRRRRTAHRVALTLLTGLDPKPLYAAHGPCHNRLCVNPHIEHGMRWATHKENQSDKSRDGTHNKGVRNPLAKLTETDVAKIRSDKRSSMKLALEFGVNYTHICRIRRRENWSHI